MFLKYNLGFAWQAKKEQVFDFVRNIVNHLKVLEELGKIKKNPN